MCARHDTVSAAATQTRRCDDVHQDFVRPCHRARAVGILRPGGAGEPAVRSRAPQRLLGLPGLLKTTDCDIRPYDRTTVRPYDRATERAASQASPLVPQSMIDSAPAA